MTRHSFEHDSQQWFVGWDEPMATYFAQREDADLELDDVTGTSIGQHTQVRSLVDELRDQVTIPDEVQAQLEREAPAFTAASVRGAELRRDELATELHRTILAPVSARNTIGFQR